MTEIDLDRALDDYKSSARILADAFIRRVADDLVHTIGIPTSTDQTINLVHGFAADEYEEAIVTVENATREVLGNQPEFVDALKRHPEYLVEVGRNEIDHALQTAMRAALPVAEATWNSTIYSKEVIERGVLSDFENVAGRIISISVLDYLDDSGSSVDIACDPPVLGRVIPLETDQQLKNDILRWMDDVHIDPIYTVELLEPIPSAPDVKHGWLYGQSWAVGKGRVESIHFELCPQEVQLEYAQNGDGSPEIPEDATFRP